ncbi:LacI family DNA-binding transcriptional regulator [Sphingomonas sp. 8AM]|uniref:LacI family DNA-binding transcriptional regulator n=1 Tax=Sphingomonas sp. 8AM TaxID=2653170 RepID=UPI0012F0F954|nr:LacI family DNA-binding transcriptional regulator [Sphingomonas sp. 8AM]VXC45477.1 LacI family transcriptional regulator [Sphingomonas sp. 8AM]
MAGTARKPKKTSARHRGAVTIADIAQLAGVSKMTVSRVISAPATVREETRERVARIIAELHYTPNRSARMLSGARQLRFGLLYNNPRSSYVIDFLMAAIDQASLTDVQLIARGCQLGEDDAVILDSLISSGIDAIILNPPLCDSPALLELVGNSGIPGLLISTDGSATDLSSISIDESAAARQMTQHLLALGHRRIGFVTGEPVLAASHARKAGFLAALEAAGIALDPALIVQGDFTYPSGRRAAEQLLGLAERPTAIFASNDDMAAAATMTARQHGLDVPSQLTICGFDDSWIATAIYPELTTIRQPIAEMAKRGVTLLSEMVQADENDDRPLRHLRLPHELVVRQSDAAPGA